MEGRLGRRKFLQGSFMSGLGLFLTHFCPVQFEHKRIQKTKKIRPTVHMFLKPARVFNGDDGKIHDGWIVVVDGEQISAVGAPSELHIPPEAQTTELPGMTLLPGLMDIHSHIFLHPYNETLWNDQVLKEPLAYRTIEAVIHCNKTLMAGFTLLRDLGTEGAGYADVSVQRAINEGLIPGPRLLVATRAIVATGCYGPGPSGFAPNLDLPKGGEEASGDTEIMKAVREQVGHGADWVKVYADYRHGVSGTVPTFSEEELRTLVAEAHSAGRPISAHATTAEGMRRASKLVSIPLNTDTTARRKCSR